MMLNSSNSSRSISPFITSLRYLTNEGVLQQFRDFDLPQRHNRHALLLVVHHDTLECNNLLESVIYLFENFTIDRCYEMC